MQTTDQARGIGASHCEPLIQFGKQESSPEHQERSKILRETFDSTDLRQATCLVGIIFEYRIVLCDPRRELEPLEPHDASHLVSSIFGHGANLLLDGFGQLWSQLRHSSTTDSLIQRLESHKLVVSGSNG